MTVSGSRDPDWTRDELILICEALRTNGWRPIRASDHVAKQLSGVLRELDLHPAEVRSDRFRSPASVQRKGFDLLTQMPGYSGKPTRGGRLDREVLQEFLSRPAYMGDVATAISAVMAGGNMLATPVDDDVESPEGAILYRRHRTLERDRTLRRRKVERARSLSGRLACEACGFDFAEVYGSVGEGYMHVHHLRPLHDSGLTSTRLEDLALLCANCHAMAHRIRPWPSVDELRALIS